jgi:ribonuclease PH
VKVERGYTGQTAGSVLLTMGRTKVLCTASVEHSVPKWMENKGRGWVTAEYGMLPGSTPGGRKFREKFKTDGRSAEIQRLIGRALRAVVDFEILGERTIWIDCDVLEADGGTRTAAITGGYIALADAIAAMKKEGVPFAAEPLTGLVGAVSVGIVKKVPMLDLCYQEDVSASVDMNVVMTDDDKLIEVQGTAEGAPFSRGRLNEMLDLATKGIRELHAIQKECRS